MKIATYNVNGVNGRLEVLLRWLEEAQRDVVFLQELNRTLSPSDCRHPLPEFAKASRLVDASPRQ